MWLLIAIVLLATTGLESRITTDVLSCRHSNCTLKYDNGIIYHFKVDDKEIMIDTDELQYLKVICNGHDVLGSAALPSVRPALQLTAVTFERCPLPAGDASLGATLSTLNVSLIYSKSVGSPVGLLVLNELPPKPTLKATHFIGIEPLVGLQITAEKGKRLKPQSGFISKLQNLFLLQTVKVKLRADELDALPSLVQLDLDDARVERLPQPPALKTLSLTNWLELQPEPLKRCHSLRRLHLKSPWVHTLPQNWLAKCSKLTDIVVENAWNLTYLPSNLLTDTHYAITRFHFKQCALKTLPVRLLRYAPRLRIIELDGNDLDNSALTAVAHHRTLEVLNLGHNKRISKVCDESGYSVISNLTKLKALFLTGTGLTHICRDWRQNMTLLKKLHLSGTKIYQLSMEDLQFTRVVNSEVTLLNTPISVIVATREDFQNASLASRSNTLVHIDAALACDCRMYWTRRMLERSLLALDHIREMRCAVAGRKRPLDISVLPAEDMVCEQRDECAEAGLPSVCSCAYRPDGDSAQDQRLVRVNCENASLDHIPQLLAVAAPPPRVYELLLAHNYISNLHANQLRNVRGLDLSNTFLKRVDEETATKLAHLDGMLRLANNQFDCSCRAAPFLRALRSRASFYTDLENITCSDGSDLKTVSIEDCPAPIAWIVAGLLILLALTFTGVVCLASRERRLFIRAVLHRWGCLYCSSEEDDDRQYDVFVTFSHKDEAMVFKLIERLEPTYRLCIHSRDWVPGLRIPDQITESVRLSRRTVALVSRHFLSSMWARFEFREAHTAAMLDAKPRLLVILLEDISGLETDNELRRYMATHTYLRWDDPWFWHKLAVALPRPRQPEPMFRRAPVAALSPAISVTKLSVAENSRMDVPPAETSRLLSPVLRSSGVEIELADRARSN